MIVVFKEKKNHAIPRGCAASVFLQRRRILRELLVIELPLLFLFLKQYL